MLSYRDFEFVRIIGTGAFGKVFLARYMHNNKYYAIKRMDKKLLKEVRQLDNIYNESLILQEACFCPFIVKFYHTIETDGYVFIVMEYIQGGELFYYIKKYHHFTEDIVRFFIAEIVLALKHLHEKGILYRDLKPENLLLSSKGHIKLADFGFATRVNENVYTLCGTPEYMAPEKLLGRGDSVETDYWSLGCLMYEMLCGLPPFYDNVTNAIYTKVLCDEVEMPRHISAAARDFMSRLLSKDKSIRLGCNGIEEIMYHPFFHGMDWNKLLRTEIEPPIRPILNQFETQGQAPLSTKNAPREKSLHSYRRIFKPSHS